MLGADWTNVGCWQIPHKYEIPTKQIPHKYEVSTKQIPYKILITVFPNKDKYVLHPAISTLAIKFLINKYNTNFKHLINKYHTNLKQLKTNTIQTLST